MILIVGAAKPEGCSSGIEAHMKNGTGAQEKTEREIILAALGKSPVSNISFFFFRGRVIYGI